MLVIEIFRLSFMDDMSILTPLYLPKMIDFLLTTCVLLRSSPYVLSTSIFWDHSPPHTLYQIGLGYLCLYRQSVLYWWECYPRKVCFYVEWITWGSCHLSWMGVFWHKQSSRLSNTFSPRLLGLDEYRPLGPLALSAVRGLITARVLWLWLHLEP